MSGYTGENLNVGSEKTAHSSEPIFCHLKPLKGSNDRFFVFPQNVLRMTNYKKIPRKNWTNCQKMASNDVR
jgi:hypothetical protein